MMMIKSKDWSCLGIMSSGAILTGILASYGWGIWSLIPMGAAFIEIIRSGLKK